MGLSRDIVPGRHFPELPTEDAQTLDELDEREVVEFVVVSLKDVLVIRVQGDDCSHVLDVLGGDRDHSDDACEDFLSCFQGELQLIRQDL